jgi:xanthine dehydrogenase accessory factor
LEAIAAARALLADPGVSARVNKVVLAADVGQCCGGVLSFWLDKFTRDDVPVLRAAADAGARGAAVLVSEACADGVRRRLVELQDEASPVDRLLHAPRQHAKPVVVANGSGELTYIERLDDIFPSVWLYGAGHVGQALARVLAELPLRLTWIDSRAELFPQTLPDSVRVLQDADSVATVVEAPVGAYFVVMSHSHPLDFELCHALLERNDFAWLGLIGSDSKAARFRSRLARTGLGPDVIEKLVCPIGVEGINSKWPAAIAVAVAAQLMQRISAAAEQSETVPTSATPVPLSAPCAPELCSTCGAAAEATPTDPTPSFNTAPDTVTS